MDQHDQLHDLVLRMEDIAYRAGLPRFDRVRLKTKLDEVWFLWEDTQLIVAVELGASSELMAAAVARTMAGAPVRG